MRRNRCVKIIATLGPASSKPEIIERLFQAGADVFRINMSHTSHAALKELHGVIRGIERKFAKPIGILIDLQGPKLRIGEFAASEVFLEPGAVFTFDRNAEAGSAGRVFLAHPEIFASVQEGHALLLDDGKLRLKVIEKSPASIRAEVVTGGWLACRKGISLPDTVLPMHAMTGKDRADLDYAMGLGADWIALSFVQREEDVAEAKKLTQGRTAVMAKIEKPSALRDLVQIIERADGLMVARGDLGVELPLEQVPGLQKHLTRAARDAGKPVVIATQMLESMISAPVPTRAEVSDVATAVFEGADAVMLSAESAAGRYPVEAVETMDKVARQVEKDPNYDSIIHARPTVSDETAADAISAAACSIAQTLRLAGIVCYTMTGTTALRAARQRPKQPILALTPEEKTARRLSLVWGLHCVLSKDPVDVNDMVEKALASASLEQFAKPGERVIICAGVPFGRPGTTNMLRVAYVR